MFKMSLFSELSLPPALVSLSFLSLLCVSLRFCHDKFSNVLALVWAPTTTPWIILHVWQCVGPSQAGRSRSHVTESSMEERGVTPRPTGIENKSLEYEVEIHDVQFNHTGRFFVKLAIQSLHTKDYSKVRVRRGQGRWCRQSWGS